LNAEENDTLKKRRRKVSFEAIVLHIERGDVLAIMEHPNQDRFPGQNIFIININDYAYLVPFVEGSEEVFLTLLFQTIRQLTRT
jgi:hypothetical protein